MRWWYRVGMVCLAAVGIAAAAPDVPVYPDRSNLLILRKSGEDQVAPIRSAQDWQRRRQQILANMQQVMGPLPGEKQRVPLDVQVLEEVRTKGYIRRKLTYASAPGERVPAYLFLPSGHSGKRPAVLALHPTHERGKDVVAGLATNADRHYGVQLAERGYVVLAPDYPTFGDARTDFYAHGWQSGTMKAIWDNVCGLDLLQSLPEVDRERLGAIGHSLGGHNALFTAAFDTRVRAAVSNCGFTAFPRYYGGNLAGWSSHRYMPRIGTEYKTPDRMPFDFHEVVAAVAPRAFLAIAPTRDDNFDVTGVREVMAAAEPVYRLLKQPERLRALYPDGDHNWPEPMRMEAYRWLDRWLDRR